MGLPFRVFLAAACVLVGIPFVSHGAGIDYVRAVENTESEILLKRKSLSEEAWYRCSFADLSCSETPRDASIAPKKYLPAYVATYRTLLPSGAQSLMFSPDLRYIAFYIPSTQSGKTRTFGVMDTTNLSVYTKTEEVSYWDLLTEGIRYFVFSPDSKTLVYLDDAAGETTPYRVNLASLASSSGKLPSEKMFSRRYTVADFLFKDNNTVWFIANRDGPYAWALYEYSLKTYDLKKISDHVSYADNMRRIGDRLLLFHTAGQYGVRPAFYDLSSKEVRFFKLPAENTLASKGKAVKLKGGLSGVFLLESSGWSDTLLVWLHGGPYRQAADGFHPYFSYGGYDWVLENLRDSDVGILKLDYPGSAGFGRAYAESITKKIGIEDATKSAAAIKDFAERNSYTKVYLMGNSYGGYLALKLLVDNPSAYRGAFSINGVADWLTLLTRLNTSIFNVQFGGTVEDDNRKNYQEASIYNYAGNVGDQKIILMHGDADSTIPVSQSEGLAAYLMQNGKNVQFIKLEGEDHVYAESESYETLCKTAFAMVGRPNTTACEI